MVRHDDYRFSIGLFPTYRLLRPGTCKRVVGWLSAVRRIVAICGLAGMLGPWALAQASSEHASNSTEDSRFAVSENTGVPVELDGRPILMVYAQIAGFTPQERAAAIQQRIIALAKRRDIAPEAIRAEERGRWTEIMAGDERIMGVTEADAIAAERSRADLASEHTEIIRLVVKQYRLDHTWQRFFWADALQCPGNGSGRWVDYHSVLDPAPHALQGRALAGRLRNRRPSPNENMA